MNSAASPLSLTRRPSMNSITISQLSLELSNTTVPSHWNIDVEPRGEYGRSPYNAFSPGQGVQPKSPSVSEYVPDGHGTQPGHTWASHSEGSEPIGHQIGSAGSRQV
eukprot:2099990-Rhodomonas_salina.2